MSRRTIGNDSVCLNVVVFTLTINCLLLSELTDDVCVCVYRLSVVSLQKDDLHIATTCVRNVPKAAGKHICVCVCCYRVYMFQIK